MSRKRKSRHAEDAPATVEDVSTGVPTEEVLAEGSEEIEAAIVEAVEALADDEPLPSEALAADAEAEAEAEAEAPADETLLASDASDLADATDGDEVEIGPAGLPTSAGSMDPVQLKQLIEALIFASDKPLTVQRLRQLTRVSDIKRLEATLAEIAADYENRGLILSSISGGYQFRTRPQFSTWVQQLIAGRPVRLSRAQLETLAIVAYRQPITRPEIDDIRGVDSSATLKLLMDRALIRVLGKKEEVGRPMLYGTTKEFLDFFSLGDLRELPTLREYSELTAESRQVISDRLGLDPAGPGGSDPSGSDGSGNGGSGNGGSDGGGFDGGGFDGGGFDGNGSDGGPLGGGPLGGGSSPTDDGGPLLDASAADLRDAAELAGDSDSVSAADADADAVAVSAADTDADADAVSAADADSDSASDSVAVSAAETDADAVSPAADSASDSVAVSAAETDADIDALSAADAGDDGSAETPDERTVGAVEAADSDSDSVSLSVSEADAMTAADAGDDGSAETPDEMFAAADDSESAAGPTPVADAVDGLDSVFAVDPGDNVSAETLSATAPDSESDADAGSESAGADGDAAHADAGEIAQLADGTGAVSAHGSLDAADESGASEVFAEGSSQFAAVTDAQLAEALAETIEPAVEGVVDGDVMLATDEEPERLGTPEPHQE